MYEEEQQKHINTLFEDFHLEKASKEDQEEALEIVRERFQNVIIYTVLEALNQEQKKAFLAALKLSEAAGNEKLQEITGEVEGLYEMIQNALDREYEAIKFAMSK